ncbi:MAG: hypothetical protein H5T97_11865 [Firmicutes bacterium]|nr:hypothetical protein [Bacillota bacterium]
MGRGRLSAGGEGGTGGCDGTFPVAVHRSVTRDAKYWRVLAAIPPEEKIRLADRAAAAIRALREGIGKCRKDTR